MKPLNHHEHLYNCYLFKFLADFQLSEEISSHNKYILISDQQGSDT